MFPLIVEPTSLGNIVGMGIVDEAPNLLTLFLVISTLVFIFDFGFNIEELSSSVSLVTLTAMALTS